MYIKTHGSELWGQEKLASYTYLFDNSYTNNQKRFWSLVKRLRKNYEPVATLYADDDLVTTSASKAEALDKQFYSVFPKEDNNTPVMSSPQYPSMIDIIFTTNGIQKLLQDLNEVNQQDLTTSQSWY